MGLVGATTSSPGTTTPTRLATQRWSSPRYVDPKPASPVRSQLICWPSPEVVSRVRPPPSTSMCTTLPECPTRLSRCDQVPVSASMSQSLTSPSSPAVTALRPPGRTATSRTGARWRSRVWAGRPAASYLVIAPSHQVCTAPCGRAMNSRLVAARRSTASRVIFPVSMSRRVAVRWWIGQTRTAEASSLNAASGQASGSSVVPTDRTGSDRAICRGSVPSQWRCSRTSRSTNLPTSRSNRPSRVKATSRSEPPNGFSPCIARSVRPSGVYAQRPAVGVTGRDEHSPVG